MNTRSVVIPSISCHHCVRTITNELQDIEGVHTIEAEVETKKTVITWDAPATWDQIRETLIEIGYPANEN